ncbi:hypothetical protein GSI_02555 [Ganoderma sinense ZZ0214-1]|uniref:Protein kinase domain-containing protein n=1 Tax=Ganoderma sinense ZZ0214-1 TaxID=1077348 RepID=A0A2G8SMG8_9APHY|nr:hypothetical protein GSI_02555 [Ganoderma sinense ZZ0214-1]
MSPLLDVPDWLKDHPDLRARGIVLHQAMEPYKSIYYTARPYGSTIQQYVVKVLDPTTEECSINERLQNNLSSPNHGLPCEVIPSEPRLLVMPFVGGLNSINYMNRPTSFFLDVYYQIIEGVEYLHRLQIAHLDICFGNIASASPYQASTDARLVAGKVYLIDFHTSRQLALGPGLQPPIVLPPSQVDKPLDVTTLDPYSFDVYCAGKVMQRVLLYTALKEPDFPWIPVRYAQWVVGNERERGCTGVCRCRPTARRARQVLTVLRWLVYASEFLGRGFEFVRRLFTPALSRQ